MRRLLSVAAVMLEWSCAELLGLDKYGSGEESGPAPSTSVGSGGGGAGGGPITMPAEVCTDGVDNDNDGAIDCEDDACANHDCLPAPPAGWIGPVALAIGDPSAIPSCAGGGAEFEGGSGTAYVPLAECPCTCNATPTLTCTGHYDLHDDVNCQLASFSGSTTNCANVMFVAKYIFASITSGNDGTCGVTSTDPPPGGVTWPMMARGCAATAGKGCGDGVCVSQPAGFDRLCIYSPGDVVCPSGDYTERSVVERYVLANDTRGCDTPCTCASFDAACSGSLTVYDTMGCTGNSTWLAIDGCTYSGFDVGSVEYVPVVSGTCVPGARTPIGDAGAFDTTTVCCKPR